MPAERVEPWFRAVTSGTGSFHGARGQTAQRNLGENSGGGANFGYEFDYELISPVGVPSPTGIDDTALRLGPARPNPFASSTAFELTTERDGRHVIDVVSITGARVSRVHEGGLSAGSHRFEWVDGVAIGGGPEAPELMIGRWFCHGTFTNYHSGPPDPGDSGAYVNQMYEFLSGPQLGSLFSEGGEYAHDYPEPWFRAITGGTEAFIGATGSISQSNIVENHTGGGNFAFTGTYVRP